MKIEILAVLAAIALPCASAHAQAGEAIVIKARLNPMALWSAAVTKSINSSLEYPSRLGSPYMDGVVSVQFVRGKNGSAAGARVVRASKFRALDRAALRAIEDMTIPQLPSGMKSDQLFEANLLFATTRKSHDLQLKRLNQDAAARNAWFKTSGGPLVLGASAAPPG